MEKNELYKNIIIAIKDTKTKFEKIIIFIEQNEDINKSLTSKIKFHLNILTELWKNNENENNIEILDVLEYYFNMKEHHSHINGHIENETLKKMWNEYIECGLKFRCNLMKLNHLCNNL